jgi:hypothetical protein
MCRPYLTRVHIRARIYGVMQGDGDDKAKQAESAEPAIIAELKKAGLATTPRARAKRNWTVRELYRVPYLLVGRGNLSTDFTDYTDGTEDTRMT